MNTIILHGHLTADPELRTSTTGKAITTFTLAVDRKYKRDGEKNADFFKCISFGKTAEFVDKYFSKGKEMILQGSMESREYEDKNGVKRLVWECKVDLVKFCGSKSDSAEENNAAGSEQVSMVDDDDLPF